ncbi:MULTISPECIES: hypothetical protein [unclassified Arthrobacter]|nr:MULTISPECIES: hypothetical protein [unclassified Arthrobacter]MCQ1987815.1 hypothetical protein [Arthrobacter sp. zg-Y844]MCQ1996220.1 hypothetical protein [Arthrobacter sp. zg-Y1171]UWX82725.1 hypothetical protein N2L00_04710 [Arthrobacter sp. zg-Y1171]
MKKFGAAALLAALIFGAGAVAQNSDAAPVAGAGKNAVQLFGNWPAVG